MIVAANVKIVLNGQNIARVAEMAEELGFPITNEESMLEFIADAVNKTRALENQPKEIQLADIVEHVIYEITYYWFRMCNPRKELTFLMDRLYADVKFEFRFRPKGSAPSLVGDDITFPIGMFKAVMTSEEVIDGK